MAGQLSTNPVLGNNPYNMGHNSDEEAVPPRSYDHNVAGTWAILLIGCQHNEYLFVKTLASGSQGTAQLCRQLNDGQLVVRKRGLQTIPPGRAVRGDRECRIARIIRRRLAELPPGAPRHRFSELISFETLPADGSGQEFFRESFWNFYDGGGNLGDLLLFFLRNKLRPHALVLNLMRSVLLALQWLNSCHIHHLDCHSKNVFLHWDGDSLVPIVGDFGYSRREAPGSPPFNDPRLWYPTSGLTADEIAVLSSPPPGGMTIQDPEERLPLDFVKFVQTVLILVYVTFDVGEPKNKLLHDTIVALLTVGEAECDNDALPEEQRPARADITQHIAAFKAAEDEYLARGGAADNEAALSAWRRENPRSDPMLPKFFLTEEAAFHAARDDLEAKGPYAIVDVANPDSIRAGVARLIAARHSEHGGYGNDSTPGDTSSDEDNGDPSGRRGNNPPTEGSSYPHSDEGKSRSQPSGRDQAKSGNHISHNTAPANHDGSSLTRSSKDSVTSSSVPPTTSFIPCALGMDAAAEFIAGSPGAEAKVRRARDRAHVRMPGLLRRAAPRAEMQIHELREQIARAEKLRRRGVFGGIQCRFVL